MNFALVNIKDFCNFEDFYWTVFRLRTLVIDRHVTQILLATLEAKKSGRNKVKSWKKFAQKRADIMQSFCWFDKSSSWNYDYFSIIIPSSISDCVVFVLSWIFNSSKICLQWKLTKIKAWINSWPRYYDLTLTFKPWEVSCQLFLESKGQIVKLQTYQVVFFSSDTFLDSWIVSRKKWAKIKIFWKGKIFLVLL